jgi:hypothetical protein
MPPEIRTGMPQETRPAGIGVRAAATSAELMTFFDTVLREPDGSVVAAGQQVPG